MFNVLCYWRAFHNLKKKPFVCLKKKMDLFSCTPKFWAENEEKCIETLKNLTADNIPLLNVNNELKNGQLVRFQGMVQDMLGPEYYIEKCHVLNGNNASKVIKSGKYCDGIILDNDETDCNDDNEVMAERDTFVVISVPGLNDWVREFEEKKLGISKNSTSNDDTSCSAEKKSRTELMSKESLLNFPLESNSGKKCHVKVYKEQEELKLNRMYEFVGFLSLDSIDTGDCDEDNRMQQEVLNPPTSLVPRLHCVYYKEIKHNNPLLEKNENFHDKSQMDYLRKELHILLTQLLLGDDLAAEYLILNLISQIFVRKQCLEPLGKFTLNISNVPILNDHDYPMELYKFIRLFTTKSHYLPLTLTNLNDLNFVPKKDYECNRLTSGILQLSVNTHLVLDETKLSSGQLNAAGVNNVKTIIDVIKNQCVNYDFTFHTIEYECDIPFLILSEGKTMLHSDVQVPLKPEPVCIDTFEEILQSARFFLKKDQLLDGIRKYLTCARLIEYEIGEMMEDVIQEKYVRMRQELNVTGDDLHRLLVLARLLTISHGKSVLDEDCWDKACKLDKERRDRLHTQK